MDSTTKMATFPRHGHLVTAFFPNILHLFKDKLVYYLQEEQILAFKGKKYSGEETLINPSEIHGLETYVEQVVDLLDYVQPDFLFFKNNKFAQTKNTLKTIGIPDLVVEVWSASNDEHEREMKFRLYSSRESCEHWYLTQTSNDVVCYMGKQKLPTQNLNEVLKTQDGITFDLRYMAM